MESIIVALIAGSFSLAGTLISNAKREQRQNDRLDAIEKKIDLHNKYGKKFGSCDKNIALMRKDYKQLKQEVITIRLDLKALTKEVHNAKQVKIKDNI